MLKLFFILLVSIVAIIWILVFIVSKSYKYLRGKSGEYWVYKELDKLPISRYLVLNDIMIKDTKGTHQIDHLVLSKYGIFVIEMKNFYGFITGNQYSNKWTQRLKGRNFTFNNPIHQNYGHIQALKKCLDLDDKSFISIICFSNQTRLNVKSDIPVVQLDYLNSKILSYQEEILNSADLVKVREKLSELNIVDVIQRDNHIREIKNMVKENDNKIANGICPKCGASLVERSGKYGKFLGCSNYPKCRFVKKLG